MTEDEFQARLREESAIIASVPPPRIKLMADYVGPLLWDCDYVEGDEGIADRLLEILHPELRARLEQWGRSYGKWATPYEPTLEEIDAFEREGIALWRLLREEFAGRASILYFSEKQHKLVAHPHDVDPFLA